MNLFAAGKPAVPACLTLFSVLISALAVTARSAVAEWPQFRGPGGRGVAPSAHALPADVAAGRHLLWKTPVGRGHSSPAVCGESVYLTTFRDEKLLTLAIDRHSGEIQWEAEAPYEKLESVHRIGSVATASVATDGEVVISFFGSSGLFCYSPEGERLWQRPMGPFDNQFGAAASPVLAEDRIVMIQDHDNGSFLATFDKRTGEELWRVERPDFRRNYSTPVLWNVEGEMQIVVAGTARITAYSLQTGDPLWTFGGICRTVSTTPVIGDDGQLYVAAAGGGAAPAQPSFEELLKRADKNGNGLLERDELPESTIQRFFGQFDRNGDGSLDREEYESIRRIFDIVQPESALALQPGGTGDVSGSHLVWQTARGIPRNASPLYYQGHLYLVKDGGIVTVLDAETGEPVKQGRLKSGGSYYSSPVLGDGKIYALNEAGRLNVITAEPDFQQIAEADFEEDVYATPAIANGRIYIRTVAHVYCLGVEP